MEVTKEMLDSTQRTFNELKSLLESKINPQLGEYKEKVAKIEKDLDTYEDANQKLVADLAESKKTQAEFKEKMEALEKQLARMPAGKGKSSKSKRRAEIKKVMDVFFRKDDAKKTAEELELERKTLRTDIDPSGGFLTPFEYYQEILKKITEISPVRAYARILRTSRESLHIPVREVLLTGNWTGENTTMPTSQSQYGIREIKINKLGVSVPVTLELLQDSVFNIDDQITSDIAESFAQTEGQAFVAGNGVTRPEGILTNPDVQIVPSGLASTFDADGLITITGELKVGYDPAYMMNRRTIAVIRKFKDGLGQYLWAPGIALGKPAEINGYPYISAIDVPDIGANNIPVIFGDFYRGYVIVDHINMYLIRDIYTQSAKSVVLFNATRRVGGLVVLAEAIKFLKCSVS